MLIMLIGILFGVIVGLYVGVAAREWLFDTGDLEQYRPRALAAQVARRAQLTAIEHHVYIARIPRVNHGL